MLSYESIGASRGTRFGTRVAARAGVGLAMRQPMRVVPPNPHRIYRLQPAPILLIVVAIAFWLVPVQRAAALINVGTPDTTGEAADFEFVAGRPEREREHRENLDPMNARGQR